MRMRTRKKKEIIVYNPTKWVGEEKGKGIRLQFWIRNWCEKGWGRYSSLAFTALIHSKWFHAPADWIIIVVVVALDIYCIYMWALCFETLDSLRFICITFERGRDNNKLGGPPPTVLTVHHKSTWLHCKWSQSFYCYFELLLRDRELIIMFFLMLYCIDSCRTLVLIICTPRFIFNFLCDDDPLHSFDYQIYIYIYVRGKNSIIIYIVPN